jgi:hypothetical protein
MADAPSSISWNWSPIAGRASSHGRIRTRRGVRAGPAPRPRANSRHVPEDFFDKTVAGVITVYGERETLLRRSWRQILKVLERESGF